MYAEEIEWVKNNRRSTYAEWLRISTTYLLSKGINGLNDHINIFNAAGLNPKFFV